MDYISKININGTEYNIKDAIRKDYICATGKSNNWSYIKYANSKIAECWLHGSIDTGDVTYEGGANHLLNYANKVKRELPFPMITPLCFISKRHTNTQETTHHFFCVKNGSSNTDYTNFPDYSTTTTPEWYVVSKNSSASKFVTIHYMIYAVGWWV